MQQIENLLNLNLQSYVMGYEILQQSHNNLHSANENQITIIENKIRRLLIIFTFIKKNK